MLTLVAISASSRTGYISMRAILGQLWFQLIFLKEETRRRAGVCMV